MLLLQLVVSVVFELTKLECLVSTLLVKLFVQIVLAIVHFLHDVFFTLNARLNLTIKLVLQAC